MVDGGMKSGCWNRMSRRGRGEVRLEEAATRPERERAQVSE